MIAFTLCSNNYVAKARVLFKSFLSHHPDATFLLVIVDRRDSRIEYPNDNRVRTAFIEELDIPGFASMAQRYSIIELNTAFKPFVFQHILKGTLPEDGIVCYIDPDIKVFQPFTPIADALNSASVVVTPHVLSPIPLDGKWPAERAFLNYGLYNLGFIAVRAGAGATAFIDWWCSRLFEQCYDDVKNGLFVDQLWINYAPLFFNTHVSRHVGLNAAYWNLHERRLTRRADGTWVVNGETPLVFYHFSSFSLTAKDKIGRTGQTRFSMAERPEMRELFDEYRQELIDAGVMETKGIPCAFKPAKKSLPLGQRIRRKLTRVIALKETPRPAPNGAASAG